MKNVIEFLAFNSEDKKMYSDGVAKLILYKEANGEEIPDKWTIIRYVGSIDNNGTKIYEGDVRKWGDTYVVVEFVHLGFCVRLANGKPISESMGKDIYFNIDLETTEYVGNIFEHPELLTA